MTRNTALWIAMLAGPVLWFLSEETGLVMTQWTCGMNGKLGGYIAFIVAFVIAAGASAFSWRQWRSADTAGQARTLAMAGTFLNAAFCMVLIAELIPHIMLAGCE